MDKFKMFNIFFLVSVILAVRAEWVSKARLVNNAGFVSEVLQETVYEIERRSWSSMKLLDINQTLNDQMYSWLVSGTVRYTNGFLISVQKIDVSDIGQSVTERVVDEHTAVFGRATARLNFRDAKIGYDVIVNLTDTGMHHFTGTFVHTLISVECIIDRNYNYNSTATFITTNVSTGPDKIAYMPATNLTEVLARHYWPSEISTGVTQIWGNEIIRPIMLDVVENRVAFPDICFTKCE